tara:strand:+ start:8413 stop:8802 length:390 start_codon:yes stop_codon:yes gene_type:complete
MPTQSFESFVEKISKSKVNLLSELDKILKVTALEMERDAKLNATKDPRVRTGRLRSSITGAVVSEQGTPRIILSAGGRLGQEVDYASYVEFGTRYIRPRLYLGRAYDKQRQSLDNRLSDLLRRVLEHSQ